MTQNVVYKILFSFFKAGKLTFNKIFLFFKSIKRKPISNINQNNLLIHIHVAQQWGNKVWIILYRRSAWCADTLLTMNLVWVHLPATTRPCWCVAKLYFVLGPCLFLSHVELIAGRLCTCRTRAQMSYCARSVRCRCELSSYAKRWWAATPLAPIRLFRVS